MAHAVTAELPEFWTRTPGFRRAHRIDLYTKATLIQRDLRPGAWTIEGIPTSSPAAADLEAGGGIIAFYRGEVLDSGRLGTLTEVEEFDSDAGGWVTTKQAGGPLDLQYATERNAHPSPYDLDFAAAETKLYDGDGETVLKAVVDDNLGPSANPSRVQPSFVIAPNLGRGGPVRDEVRMDLLGDLLVGWATTAGLIPVCKVSDGGLLFDVYEPRDLTGSDPEHVVAFSVAKASASRVVRTERAPELNWSWVGGQGEGTARQFVSGGDSTSQLRWGFRSEQLRDRRDTNDTAVLEQTRDEELATKAASLAVEVDPIEAGGPRYLIDYRIGDLVSAITGSGLVVSRQVREVRLDCTPADVVRFQPLVGDPLVLPPGTMDLFGQVRDIRSRLVTQEAR